MMYFRTMKKERCTINEKNVLWATCDLVTWTFYHLGSVQAKLESTSEEDWLVAFAQKRHFPALIT